MEIGLILLPWLGLLGLAIYGLLRGADTFVVGASRLGVIWGMAPFVVGVLIVGLGTSLPELATSLAALSVGANEVILANVVGSNITNILLVGGVLALLSRRIDIKENLLVSELPLFTIATVHFVLILQDGMVSQLEGGLLIGTLVAYLWYLKSHAATNPPSAVDTQPAESYDPYLALTLALGGILVTILGAHYTVVALLEIATVLTIPVSVLSIVVVAVGTSLPELAVSLQAVRQGEAEMAIGNIFGSNAFNIFVVAGIPALFVPLMSTPVIQDLGLYVMIAASVIFFVGGLARQLQPWEGAMMLLFYGFFLINLLEYL